MAKKILLVDDDKNIRELYQQLLVDAGYEVDTAEEGKTGYEKIIQKAHELVLLDVMMPLIDGIGILKKLHTEKTPHPPIVLLTNLIHDPVTKEAIDLGALTYLDKSAFDPPAFLQKIEELLQ